MDIRFALLTAENHGGAYIGDYLLLFRSENRKNTRFGGFLIFADAFEADVRQMQSEGEASYVLGTANGESSSLYNPADGIDKQIAILFTNIAASAGESIIYNSESCTLTTILQPNADIVPGNWLTMRAYLWDSADSVILEVSGPGNTVHIQ
ncbi:MAG: hypothetical protein JXN64_02695 [Spirochaetes bacterium]|nr:hypothetical protein [Spirochaetota bacterium]